MGWKLRNAETKYTPVFRLGFVAGTEMVVSCVEYSPSSAQQLVKVKVSLNSSWPAAQQAQIIESFVSTLRIRQERRQTGPSLRLQALIIDY